MNERATALVDVQATPLRWLSGVEEPSSSTGIPVSTQCEDALSRIRTLEAALRRSERLTEAWCQTETDNRLKLRVALQEQRERMDLERYRLERLAEVTRIPWWRIRKRRTLLKALQEDLSASGRG